MCWWQAKTKASWKKPNAKSNPVFISLHLLLVGFLLDVPSIIYAKNFKVVLNLTNYKDQMRQQNICWTKLFCVTTDHKFAQCQKMSNLKPSQVLYLHTYSFWHFDKLSGLNFKAAPWTDRFLYPTKIFSSRFRWHIRLSKRSQKVWQRFWKHCQSVYNQFSLKLLTKPAGSYKQSYHLKVFLKQVVFNVV